MPALGLPGKGSRLPRRAFFLVAGLGIFPTTRPRRIKALIRRAYPLSCSAGLRPAGFAAHRAALQVQGLKGGARNGRLKATATEVADRGEVCYIEFMTKLLEKALEKISSLPQEEQDAIASQILAELEDEAAWAKRFAAQRGKLRRLADEALAEHRQGETRPLDDLL